ncbi:hypothetical protein HY411_01635 [Candidatus Gottesmanbacteria bacterium]|nr:hypothetical protein [Candidatus Gottesmanbacteria bacterium]
MKYLKTLLFLFVLLLFSLKTPFIAAQETQIAPADPGLTPEKMMPPRPPDDTPILGQEHAYSVLFRGNGDAVVTMRAAFTNEEQVQTNTVSFRVPRVEPRRISAFQIIREPQCIRYKPYSPNEQAREPQCMEYQETNYFQWYGQAKYQKATTQFTGDTLTIVLPQSIKPAKSGSVLVVFSASGYAKKDIFGTYSYAFETFKVEDTSVTKATIGISVDSDLVLAGAKGTVNYRFSEAEAMSLASGVEKMAGASPQLDQMYSQVGYGTITKTASHLEPLESFTVKGRYADSAIRLYGKGILIGLGIFVAAVVLLFFLGRAATRALTNQQVKGVAPSPTDMVVLIGGSFLSAALIAVYTAGLFLLRNTVQQVVSYEMVGIVFILATIISIGVYGLLLIAPAILVGLRRGLAWGMGAFGLTILFLVVNAVIMIVVLMLLYGNGVRPMPIYNIMKGFGPEVNRMDAVGVQESYSSQESPAVLESTQ